MRKLTRAKLAELTGRLIRLADAGRPQDAMALIRSGLGQDQMDEIRLTIADLRKPLSRLMAAGMADRKNNLLLTEEMIGALLAIIVLFGVFSAAMILINLKERERIIAEKDRAEIERASLLGATG